MFPDISVIVMCYNYGRYLERCLRSLYNQEHTTRFSYEIILINDGSKDNTDVLGYEFEKKFKNFVYLTNIKNQGVAKSFNIGIGNSNGRYIVRVDADDYVSRHFLFLLKFALDKNRNYQAFCCDYIKVDKFENDIQYVSPMNTPISSAVMYRKEFLVEVGYYDETFNPDYENKEGQEMNKHFTEKYKIGYIPIPLYFTRRHQNNRSNKTGNQCSQTSA